MSEQKSWRPLIKQARRVVIKIGTRVLTDPRGKLDPKSFSRIAGQIAELWQGGRRVVVVSSGAIVTGRKKLGRDRAPLTIPEKQALAALGQPALMRSYEQAFRKYSLPVAQILLTHEDFSSRERYLYCRNTLGTLLRFGVLPVINENDTVAVDEIKFGDNDTLSALVAVLFEADLLVLLSDIEGLCEQDPSINPDAKVIPLVRDLSQEIYERAGPTRSGLGIGGMSTKIQAARTVAAAGIPTFIGNGKTPEMLLRLFEGKIQGTLFLPGARKLKHRKHWIAFVQKTRGEIIVDDGARHALVEGKKSLLPSGVLSVNGRFVPGDAVKVQDSSGRQVGVGLVRYSPSELERIKGKKTSEVQKILGDQYYQEVIHRDDLVLMEEIENPGKEG
jgi:glutamate 5-kinase